MLSRAALLMVALPFLLHSRAGHPASCVPRLEASGGYDDNVNARPEETLVEIEQEQDSFLRLRPSARAVGGVLPGFFVGAGYGADWRAYGRARTGDSVAHAASVDARLLRGRREVSIAAGLSCRSYPNFRDTEGRRFLDFRTRSLSVAGKVPATREGKQRFVLGAHLAAREFPAYLAPADPGASGCLERRDDTLLNLTGGIEWRPRGWASYTFAYRYARLACDSLVLQAGELRDFFSYSADGIVVKAVLRLSGFVRLDLTTQYQYRRYLGRIAPEGETEETAGVTYSALAVTWQLRPETALFARHDYFCFDSDNPRDSYVNHRLSAGLKLTGRVPL